MSNRTETCSKWEILWRWVGSIILLLTPFCEWGRKRPSSPSSLCQLSEHCYWFQSQLTSLWPIFAHTRINSPWCYFHLFTTGTIHSSQLTYQHILECGRRPEPQGQINAFTNNLCGQHLRSGAHLGGWSYVAAGIFVWPCGTNTNSSLTFSAETSCQVAAAVFYSAVIYRRFRLGGDGVNCRFFNLPTAIHWPRLFPGTEPLSRAGSWHSLSLWKERAV